MKKVLFIVISGAGLLSCSSVSLNVRSETIAINKYEAQQTSLDSMVSLYKDSVDQEMNEIIAFCENDLIAVKKPSGALSNWVADAIFVHETKNKRLAEPAFCLLNHGGIRSTLNKGQITLGDMFKVMPFDNEIVWVRMPVSELESIARFMRNRGGDPLANAVLTEKSFEINGIMERHTHVWIITSDYLMNGGDNMEFFKKGTEVNYSGTLLRDALIEEARSQGTLLADTSNRMLF
jgi:2',3'-cyclic-nucleotide 2'-phosphodiesterase (5'-nucleotidase family)